MMELSGEQIREYLYRSYAVVDGLWFMAVERRFGFETALDVDEEVWKVVPKIQARKLKELTGLAKGLESLLECLTTKLTLDGFEFDVEKDEKGKGFEVVIHKCPWHALMIKSDRTDLSAAVGDRICNAEYAVWAKEFGDDIEFALGSQLCKGGQECRLRFSRCKKGIREEKEGRREKESRK